MHTEFRFKGYLGSRDSYCQRVKGRWDDCEYARRCPLSTPVLSWNVCSNILQIKDAVGNEYGKPKDVAGEQRMAFTSHADAAFDVCFENILSGCK